MTTDKILDAWREWQTAQGLSRRTIYERTNTVRHLLHAAKVGPLELQPSHIISYMARDKQNGEPMSDAARASYHASIRAYCKWLVRSERREDDPTIRTPTPKRPQGLPRPFGDEEIDRVLAVANDDHETLMMIMLYALGGIREFEIAKFHDDDVDLVRGVMTITGKGGKTAPVALQAELSDFMKAFRAGKPRGHWFQSPEWSGRAHITRSWVYVRIKRVLDAAGVEGGPHRLRHWFGTSLIENGVPLRVVQELMRHSSPATTAIYTKVDMRLQRRGIASIRTPGRRSLYGDDLQAV